MPMDMMTMLQRQMEVTGSLRNPVRTPQDLKEVHAMMKALAVFMGQISKTATKLQLPLESVFQCLMHMGLGGTAVDFDKQHRQGNVPMHQAKVLDRNSSLNAQKVEPSLREVVEPELLEKHVHHCQTLRTVLRMKVEDGNDLSMARKLVSLGEEYLDAIFEASGRDEKRMFDIFMAQDEREITQAITGGAANGDNGDGTTHHHSQLASSLSGGVVGPSKPLPADLCRGFADESKFIQNIKTDVASRQVALTNLIAWTQEARQADLDKSFAAIIAVLEEPLKVQLGEKRSAICRLACELVSFLSLRSNPGVLNTNPKVKEVFARWCEIVLKGVHVTVAAIAEASDSLVRDIIISSCGCSTFVHVIEAVLTKAAQPELRRKCLNYLALAALCAASSGALQRENALKLGTLAVKLCSSNEDATRRVARVLYVVLHHFCCLQSIDMPPLADAKVGKLVDQEAPAVTATFASLDEFEVVTLRYSEPCPACALWLDKLQNGNSPTRSQHQEQLSASVSLKESSPPSHRSSQSSTLEVSPGDREGSSNSISTTSAKLPTVAITAATSDLPSTNSLPSVPLSGRQSPAVLSASALSKRRPLVSGESNQPRSTTGPSSANRIGVVKRTSNAGLGALPSLSPNAVPLSLRSLTSDMESLRVEPPSPVAESAMLSSLKRRTAAQHVVSK